MLLAPLPDPCKSPRKDDCPNASPLRVIIVTIKRHANTELARMVRKWHCETT